MKVAKREKSTLKMSSEERRASIVKAARRVFAEKGFYGTTTRALAEGAGVSEALLFKHFPNKEALFSAMQLSCLDEQDQEVVQRMLDLESSASTLVLMVHFVVLRLLSRSNMLDDDHTIHHRLMMRSLAENGEFARYFLKQKVSGTIEKFQACLEVAIAAGEAYPGPVQSDVGGWFVHHLAAMTMVYQLPENPVVDYGIPREKLVEQLVWFAMRGIGLKEEAIKRYYNPKALAMFAK